MMTELFFAAISADGDPSDQPGSDHGSCRVNGPRGTHGRAWVQLGLLHRRYEGEMVVFTHLFPLGENGHRQPRGDFTYKAR